MPNTYRSYIEDNEGKLLKNKINSMNAVAAEIVKGF